MLKKSYRQKRIAFVTKNLHDYQELLTWDPFRDWALNSVPDSSVFSYLNIALEILCSHDHQTLANAYLDLSCKVAERILKEKKCSNARCKDGWPMNQGHVLRGHAYAKGLQRAPLDLDAIAAASVHLEKWCGRQGRDWTQFEEELYLCAIRLSLICDNWERAEKLLTTKKRFGKKTLPELAIWRKILASSRTNLATDLSLASEFDVYFDKIRNPLQAEDVMAVELGILREKLFEGHEEIDWKEVIAVVSK